MATSLASNFLKAIILKKDVHGVIDKELIYPLGIDPHFDNQGTQCPTAFLMFNYQNIGFNDLLDMFERDFMKESYDTTSGEIFLGLGKKKEKHAKEDFQSFNRELFKNVLDQVDDKNDYSELYKKITGGVKSSVKLGEMIYTISQKIMTDDYDKIDNSRKLFAGIMTTALIAKCASLNDETLAKQANGIDDFLASALREALPEEIGENSSDIFDEICDLTRSTLKKCGLPEENVKKYFTALNIYDQAHSTTTKKEEWNYRFSVNPDNTFIAFNDNGRITNYFHDMRSINTTIQDMLDELKKNPSNDTYAYSLIQKVGASLSKKTYPADKIDLESMSAEDAQTVLLTTLNLLSTIEKDIDPSKKEAFDSLLTTLMLPATEINNAITDQVKKNVVDKVKDLCTTDPEISAVPGISDIIDAESDESKIARLTAERNELSTEKSDLEKEKTEKAEEIADLRAEITGLTAERDDLSTKKNDLEKEKAEKDEEIADLRAEITGLTAERDDLSTKKNDLEKEKAEKDEEIARLTAAVNATPRLKKPQDPYKMALGWLKTEIRRMSKKATKKGEYEEAEKLNNLYTNIEFYKNNIDPNDLDSSIKKTNIANQRSLHIGMHYCSNVAAFAIEKRDDGTTIVDKKDVTKSLREEIIPQMLDDYGKSL